MFKHGDKIDKVNYTKAALWCNSNKHYISKVDDEYVIISEDVKTEEEIIEREFNRDKEIRTIEMSSLTVEVDGYVLQADEESQNRMVRAILVLQKKETIQWVTANNEFVMISKEQLEQALRKAVEAQTEIWGKPHKNKYNKKHPQNKE